MKSRNVRKIISFISSFNLILQTFLPLTFALPVYAEESTPSATVETTPTPEITPEVIPLVEPTPEITPEIIPTIESTSGITPDPALTVEVAPDATPTPTIEITSEISITPGITPDPAPTIEPTPTETQNNSPPAEQTTSSPESTTSQTETSVVENLPQPIITVSQLEQTITPEITSTDNTQLAGMLFLPQLSSTAIEQTCITNETIVNSTESDWNIDNSNGISETKNTVELGVRYIFPQENKVSVTFKCLPKDKNLRTSLKIQQVKIGDLKLPDNINSFGEYAYDITTDMADGSFDYDLTLPKPENQSVGIVYMEDKNSTPTPLTDDQTSQGGSTVKASDLNHFTIFVVINPTPVGPPCVLAGATTGTGCYSTIQAAIDAANNGDEIEIQSDITVTQQVNVNKDVTIDGNGFTVTPTFFKTSNSNNASFGIHSSGVTIKNLTIDGTLGTNLHGINIYMVNGVLLDSVSVLNNDYAGIVVNGSIVTVNNIITAGNGWGGINVDQGTSVTTEAKLIVNGTSSHNEAAHIWIDDARKVVSVVDNLNQYDITVQGHKRIYVLKTSSSSNPSASLEQCRNGAAGSPNNCLSLGGSVGWVNGNAGSSNSHYVEGFSIPYRAILEDLPINTPITITLEYDIKHSGAHAIDFLTSYDRLQPHSPFGHTAESVDPTSGVTGLSATTTTYAIPAPSIFSSPVVGQPATRFDSLPANEKLITLFGGTISNVAYVTQGDLNDANASTSINVTFTADSSNAVLAWGGHIAQEVDWGINKSAGGINGSPYHMRLKTWTQGNLGNQDRSLSAGAVAAPSSITIIKDAQPNSSQDFSFTTTGNGLSNFILDDDNDVILSNSQKFDSLLAGTFSIIENATTGWTLNSKNCITDGTSNSTSQFTPITNGFSINLVAGENITCTFTNTQQNGTLRVNKITVPNEAEIFSVTAAGSGTITGNATQNVTGGSYVDFMVTTGTYSVTESPKTGWSETENTCTNVSVPAGGMGECTITNSQRGSIFGYKYEDVNGDGQSGDWTPIQNWIIELWQGQAKVGQTQTLVNGYFSFTNLIHGEYTLTEQIPSGWTNVSANSLNVSLNPGENDGSNNFVNTRYGTIIVEKQTLPDGDLQNFTFTGDIAGTVADGETISVINRLPGRYSSTEVLPNGWDLTSISCSDQNSSGNINTGVATFNVESGETVKCTFTNTKRAHIIIEKNAIPDGSQVFTFNNNFGNGNLATFSLTDDNTVGLPNYNAEVLPGTYSVSENEITGWKQDSTVCDNGETIDNIDVTAGETVTCTFTNKKLATITLVKNTVGGNGSFDFDATGIGLPTDIDLTTVAGVASQSFTNLDPDNIYSILENVPAGWNLTSATCNNGDSISRITPNAGEEITCTITNTKLGRIIVKKETNLVEDQTEFRFSSSYSEGNFYLSDGEQNDSGYLTPGTYSVRESSNEGDGWKLTSAVCSNEDTPNEITLGAGEEVICTFTNEYTKPELQISKSNFAGGDKTPGEAVTYRILLKVLGSDIDGITVKDLLPKGFIYRPGSYQVKINGLIVDIDEPNYHSPGTWIIDYLVKAGQEVELLYIADISGDQQPGIYPDAAWAIGTSMAEEEVIALAQIDGFVDTNFVGTEVNVIKNQTRDDSYSVEKEETKKGEVLGATTTLPATGASPAWLMLAFVCFVYGIRLIKSGNKK